MAFRECGTNSLPELLAMLLFVAGASYAVAYAWIVALEDFYDLEAGELPNMAAAHVLNLIVGFLYVGLIRKSIETWVATMQTANDFMLTSHSMVLVARGSASLRQVLQRVEQLRKAVRTFYTDASSTHAQRLARTLCCGGRERAREKVQRCLGLRDRMHSLRLAIPDEAPENSRLLGLFGRLENILAAIESKYFAKEPACFKWHLRLLLFAYFACLPVQLFNAYGKDMTLLLYPIIIYFLFSVALLASVFQNPIEHPELNECFEALNVEIMKDVRSLNNGQPYLRTLSIY